MRRRAGACAFRNAWPPPGPGPRGQAGGQVPRGRLAAPEEPALERPEDLGAHERLRVGDLAVVARDADVVLERSVRPLERVLELVALEDVVVAPRRVARAVLRIDRTADRPDATRLPLDPDEDAL